MRKLSLLIATALTLSQHLHAQTLWGLTSAGGSNNLGNIFSLDASGQNFKERHAFSSPGTNPNGQHLLDNGDGYQYAVAGMPYGGILYRMLPDGTGYQVIYKFSGTTPNTGLVKGPDGYFYGGSRAAGASNGTIYKISSTGSGFQLLHSFTGSDGAAVTGELVYSGSSFYGVTQQGGTSNDGVMFTIKSDGSGFAVLHNFNALNGYGGAPKGPLAVSVTRAGTIFYGTASSGGEYNYGVMYQFSLTGNAYQVLYQFPSTMGHPSGSLLRYGSVYYGTSKNFSANGNGGVLYSFSAATQNISVVHVFPANGSGQDNPDDGLINIGQVLYGSTAGGNGNARGTIYKTNLDGSSYQIIYFQPTDANSYYGSLSYYNNQLYGITQGITETSSGSVFKLNTDGSGYAQILSFNDPGGYAPYGSLIKAADGNLYGVTTSGGNNYADGAAFSIKTDGSAFTPILSFPGPPRHGRPTGSLIQATNGSFYGLSQQSGPNFTGAVFQLAVTPSLSYTEYPFCYTNGCSFFPVASLLQASDGNLYGMTPYTASPSFPGTIFRMSTTGTGYSVVFSFPAGVSSTGSLLQAADGYLYGLTQTGSANNLGSVFKVHTDGTGYQTIFQFGYYSGYPYGYHPCGSLVLGKDSKLYGMTDYGGGTGVGTVFRMNTDGSAAQTLLSFTLNNGGFPVGSLVQDPATAVLYGMTDQGGPTNNGTVFKINPDGTGFTTLLNFNGANGNHPKGDLLLLPAGSADKFANTQESVSTKTTAGNAVVSLEAAPNPVHSSFTIHYSNPSPARIMYMLTDMNGKQIKQSSRQSAGGEDSDTIDMNGLPAGLYILKASVADHFFIKKIIKQ